MMTWRRPPTVVSGRAWNENACLSDRQNAKAHTRRHSPVIIKFLFASWRGVNPEVAHEHMAGLNFSHAVAMALWQKKLFHIDLNDQAYGRYDQDFRFGSESPKAAFFLVKLLEDHGYDGYKHFDSHAYRTSDRADVVEFARGSMRTYLALKDAAKRWNSDETVKKLLAELPQGGLTGGEGAPAKYSLQTAQALRKRSFDREAMAARRLPYEALDQRTIEILMGR